MTAILKIKTRIMCFSQAPLSKSSFLFSSSVSKDMRYEIATSILKNVGIISCIFWVLLFFGFVTETANGNLEGDELGISIVFLIFCFSCIGGLCVVTNTKNHKIGLIVTVFSVLALQISLVVVNFIEWADPKCEKDILALCTAGTENFLLMICISAVLHSAFFCFWKALYVYTNCKPTHITKVRTVVNQEEYGSVDDDSIAVNLSGSSAEKEIIDL